MAKNLLITAIFLFAIILCASSCSFPGVTNGECTHSIVTDEAVAPSCTEEGLTAGKHCSLCGEITVAQKTVEATGHTEVEDAAVAPTCTENGLTAGSHCSVCEKTLIAQETVKVLGHKEVIDNAVASSCTEDGLTAGVHCSVCFDTIIAQEVIPASHSFSEWARVSEPDCFFAGEDERSCSMCSESETREVAVLEHSFVQNEETKLFSCEKCDARILNGHLYAAFDVELNWYDAYKICDSLGGYLVTITSSTEQALMNEIIGTRSFDLVTSNGYFYWIGGIRNTSGWKWITGETMKYTNWGARESSEDSKQKNQWNMALATNKSAYNNEHVKTGEWEDLEHWLLYGFVCEWELEIEESEHFFTEWETVKAASCFADGEQCRICTHCGFEETELITVEHNFVFNEATGITSCVHCSAATYNGKIYKIFNVSLSWFDAYTYCESLGGHLATITSADEQTFVESYMNSLSYTKRTLIGAYNDGNKWNWVTEEEFDYSNWGVGQPNNDKNQEYFGEINHSGFGLWNDIPAIEVAGALIFCEWEATE